MSRNKVLVKKIEEALIEEYGDSLAEYGTAEAMARAAYDAIQECLAEQFK